MFSTPFNFLKLPAVVKRKVLKLSELRDLFILSQLSHKSYDLVQDAVFKGVKCGLRLRRETVDLLLNYRVRNVYLVFVFGKHGFYELYGPIEHGRAVLNGEKFDYHFDTKKAHYLYTRDREDTDAINTIFRYFSGLFHFSNYSTIFLYPDFMEYFESTELFEDYMSRIGNPKIELLHVMRSDISSPDLIRFIDNVDCTDMIKIDEPVRGKLNYHKIRTLNSIQMWNGQVKEDDFLNFRSKNLFLKKIRFTERVLVNFVKKWLRNESKIESLILKIHESKAWKSQEEVFGWLGTTAWNPRTRGRYYKWKKPGVFDKGLNKMEYLEEWDCSEGLDIVRSDGLLATIHLTEDTFTFFVWNHRFH